MKPAHPLTEESVQIARALAPYGNDKKAVVFAIQCGLVHPIWRFTSEGDVWFMNTRGDGVFFIYTTSRLGFTATEAYGSALRWTNRFGTTAALLKHYGESLK